MKARWLVAALWVAACGKPDGSLAGAEPAARPKIAQRGPEAPAIYDAQGRLLGSGTHVSWLEIPRGFSQRPAGANADVIYEADGIPITRVRDFFTPQMLTGSAEELGQGVIYRGVMPQDGKADAMRFDVSVLEVAPKGRVFLTISPASFPNVKPISEVEARKVLATQTKNAE